MLNMSVNTNNETISQERHGRLYEISFLNVLFTVMVVCVHILSEPITGLDKQAPVYLLVYTPWKLFQFVTQGFIFLSGLKIGLSSKRRGIWSFYSAKIIRVYLPYVLWATVTYAFFVAIKWYVFSIKGLAHGIFLGVDSAQFYFVIIIMQLYLLTPLILRLTRKCEPTLLILYSLFVSLLCGQYLPQMINTVSNNISAIYNDRLFTTYLFYFVAGIVAGQNYKCFMEKLKRSKAAVFVSFSLFAALDLYISYLSYSRSYIYWCDMLHFAYTVTAIPAFLLFADMTVGKIKGLMKYVMAADRSSYMIFLSHILVLYIVRFKLDDLNIKTQSLRLILVFVIMALYFVLSITVWNYIKDKLFSKNKV